MAKSNHKNLRIKILTALLAIGVVVVQSSVLGGASVESRLRGDPNLTLFTKAMDIANFWERLAAGESFTLFVPTDKAMTAEGSAFLLNTVLMTTDNRERLEALLSAHVVFGTLKIKPADGSALLPTLSGDCLLVTLDEAAITVGSDAQVLADEVVSGARILTVDKLLIPDYQPSKDCVAAQSAVREN